MNVEEQVLEIEFIRSPKRDRPRKTIVGYCWPWTGRVGEQIDFKVSVLAPGEYQAELVRIDCGDNLSVGSRYKEESVLAPFAGRYSGRYQPTHRGSFIQVPSSPVLDGLHSFTVQTMLSPTRLSPRRQQGSASTNPTCEQHLVSRWDPQRRQGWALLIDGQDRLVFRVGGHAVVRETTICRRLIERRWYLARASVDLDRRRITLAVESRGELLDNAVAESVSDYSQDSDFSIVQAGPLLLAACGSGVETENELRQTCCFSGRLDRVRISGAAIDHAAARLLCAPEPQAPHRSVVGFWDFAADIDKIEVRDLSGNGLDGTVVNAPMRAVAGVDWNGSTTDWRQAPQHYSAIHFHDDDLYDAKWQTDFHFRIPEDLPSGVYAARLRQGQSEDYVPFFVCPPKGKPRASVALLLPTITYTAYTNVMSVLTGHAKVLREGPDGQLCIRGEGVAERTISCDSAHLDLLIDYVQHELGAGVYGPHTDGTQRTTASQKQPNITIKPKSMNWTLGADTYLIDWLRQKKISYDVITDDLLHQEGLDLLRGYRVVMTGNHPEYYSKRMLEAVDGYRRRGGRWMYLGGNGFYWVTSVHSQLPGLIEVRKSPEVAEFERRHAFDGVGGGLWRDNGQPPQRLVGVGHSAVTLNDARPYRRLPESYDPRAAFIFDGVKGESFGDFGIIGGGAAGQEVDRVGGDLGTPVHALHLARAEGLCRTHPDSYDATAAAADVVFFEGPHGGAVFSVGSMAWIGALSHNAYDNDISRITENVLRRFLEEKLFEFCGR